MNEPRDPLGALPTELVRLVLEAASPSGTVTIHNARYSGSTLVLKHDHPAIRMLERLGAVTHYRAVSRQFRDLLPPRLTCLLVPPPRQDSGVRLRAGENTWFPEDVVLRPDVCAHFACEVFAPAANTEVIGAFSHSRQRYGQQGADALTWYAAPHRSDFGFRTRMFEYFSSLEDPGQNINLARLVPGRWHLFGVTITTTTASYWLDGSVIAVRSLDPEDVDCRGFCRPPGRFGLVTYASQYYWRNAVVDPGV